MNEEEIDTQSIFNPNCSIKKIDKWIKKENLRSFSFGFAIGFCLSALVYLIGTFFR